MFLKALLCYLELKHSQNDLEPARKVWDAQVPTDPPKRWNTVIPITEELKAKAKKLGLWNLFLSKKHYPEYGVPLTNLEVCGCGLCLCRY